MCLVALSIDPGGRFPFVVAANRDEFFARPTAPLGWWSPGKRSAPILAGRDLQAGGTWLGLNAAGRFGFVTNVRGMMAHDPAAPSRGEIVPEWLAATEPTGDFLARTLRARHNGFNLIVADAATSAVVWASNCAPEPVTLGPGIHAVSNHLLDTPWPKLVTLKSRLGAALAESSGVEDLADRLFAALADRAEAPPDRLPATGIPPDRERRLSPAFIHMPDIGYGTRCSTLVIAERTADGQVTHVFERSFGPSGEAASLQRVVVPTPASRPR